MRPSRRGGGLHYYIERCVIVIRRGIQRTKLRGSLPASAMVAVAVAELIEQVVFWFERGSRWRRHRHRVLRCRRLRRRVVLVRVHYRVPRLRP